MSLHARPFTIQNYGTCNNQRSRNYNYFLQSHFFNDLLILLFGSLAVFFDVRFLFIPNIRLQNESRLLAAAGDFFASAALTGLLMFLPCAFKESRPF